MSNTSMSGSRSGTTLSTLKSIPSLRRQRPQKEFHVRTNADQSFCFCAFCGFSAASIPVRRANVSFRQNFAPATRHVPPLTRYAPQPPTVPNSLGKPAQHLALDQIHALQRTQSEPAKTAGRHFRSPPRRAISRGPTLRQRQVRLHRTARSSLQLWWLRPMDQRARN